MSLSERGGSHLLKGSKDKSSDDSNLMTQSELFRSYSYQNHLYLNLTSSMMWFEFGGNRIAKLSVIDNSSQQQSQDESTQFTSWRLVGKYKSEFPCHFTPVYLNGGA